MEDMKIEAWLNSNSNGNGEGYGYGYGSGHGYGNGEGYGQGYGSGSGHGDGDRYGNGIGSGYGDGDGEGRGHGLGDGYGNEDLAEYKHMPVHMVDGIRTIITHIHGNIAKGCTINTDMTTSPCYIAKGHGLFAHGETINNACDALEEKRLASMDTEEAIEQFKNTFTRDTPYLISDFYKWHHVLTGSCELGRTQFAKEHNLNLENERMTVEEFIKLTKDAFGGSVIRRLAAEMNINISE